VACFRRSPVVASPVQHRGESMRRAEDFTPAHGPTGSCQPGQGVHLDWHRPDAGVVAGTRPYPVRGDLHQPTPHWVVVDVLDHGQERLQLADVPVMAAAALPEAIMHRAAGLNVAQAFQECRGSPWLPSSRFSLRSVPPLCQQC